MAAKIVGYSGKSLVEKLGIKEGYALSTINAPLDYDKTLGKLPKNTVNAIKANTNADFTHYFTRSRKEFEKEIVLLKRKMKQDGMLWVSWPKTVSGVQTDLNENVIRDIALQHGLVDIKVCAIDEIWSGLKLVIRKENRK